MGILEFTEDGEGICEEYHIGHGSGKVVSDLSCFFRASASALKLVDCFTVAYGDVGFFILIPAVHHTFPISGNFCCRIICVNEYPLVF